MKQKILFGGYTRRIGKGIYSLDLDVDKKELSNLKLLVSEPSPTYLAVDKKGFLYSVGAVENSGGIAAFSFEYGRLRLLNRVVEKNIAPLCFVAVDEKRNLVYGANYHQGIIYVYRRENDGSLRISDKIVHKGSGSHKNQQSPHVHYTDLTPDQRLVVCDLGTDGVYTYDLDQAGKLTEVAVYHATNGAGSRHIVFHPNHEYAYLFCELNSTIEVLRYHPEAGKFELALIISTLPNDYSDFNSGAALRISSDGRFLYASNRGHNSIVCYKIRNSGAKLELLEWFDTEGDFPRDFNLSKSENFLIVANQNTDNVTLFLRNSSTGMLTLCQKNVFLPEGTAVCPVNQGEI